MLPDLSGRHMVFETGRAMYLHGAHAIAHAHKIQSPAWRISVPVIAVSHTHLTEWFYAVRDFSDFDFYLDQFVKKPSELKRMERFLFSLKKKASGLLEKKRFEKRPDEKLSQLILLYCNHREQYNLVSNTLRHADRTLISRLSRFLKRFENADETIAALSVPVHPSFAILEEMELLALAASLKKKKAEVSSQLAQGGLKKIRQKYGWSTCGYFNECAKTLLDYQKILSDLLRSDPAKMRSDIRQKIREDQQKQKRALLLLDKKEKKLGKVASQIVYLKDLFRFLINHSTFLAEPLFEEIAKRQNVTVAFLKDLTPSELSDLAKGKHPNKKTIVERTGFFVMVFADGQFEILTGKKAVEFERRYLVQVKTVETEFKGRCASAGTAKGKAVVVLSKNDFSKVKQGQILVVSNTGPEFVPIMRRAAAIVAEEGGLTAHVSVVSREFGIPCVVGLSGITKKLKDGELLEVNATNGTVRVKK